MFRSNSPRPRAMTRDPPRRELRPMVIQSNFRQICRDPAVALCVRSCIVPDGRANVIDDPRGLVSGSVCSMLDSTWRSTRLMSNRTNSFHLSASSIQTYEAPEIARTLYFDILRVQILSFARHFQQPDSEVRADANPWGCIQQPRSTFYRSTPG